ncbi:uncharacterized protein LAJ45_02984 [Morchella importuna]|uniref:uncharacterized protein n=1 Tax=Morchella importuna TaxID=1174673 RepID=UPI001E8D6D16|nr:uncharacterized protein LAJ45_02984 [Morchella importuna]KAH8152760.1 hypothetical protein LAJ45_02984 [Morchella importuna]
MLSHAKPPRTPTPTNGSNKHPKTKRTSTVLIPPLTPLNVNNFYNIQLNDDNNDTPLANYLKARIEELSPPMKMLIESWENHCSTIEDKRTKVTLDYAVRVLQTHQADTATICLLLDKLTKEDINLQDIQDHYQQVRDGLRAFAAHSGRSQTPLTSFTLASSRDYVKSQHRQNSHRQALKGLCHQRDRNISVLSQATASLEVVHIIPHSVRGDKINHFCALVRMFSKEDVAAMLERGLLGPEDSIDNLKNLMLLDASEHRAFDTQVGTCPRNGD